MKAITDVSDSPASSLMRFCASDHIRARYRTMVSAGDLGDKNETGKVGRPHWAAKERIDAEMLDVIERIRSGEKAQAVADDLEINYSTLRDRLRTRGLNVRKIKTQKQ